MSPDASRVETPATGETVVRITQWFLPLGRS